MMHSVLLDPIVVLNPLSFAFHLAVFVERNKPVAIPLGWLWEEIRRRYGLLTIGEIMGYHSSGGSQSLNEPIYTNSYPLLSPSCALLATACRRGLIRPVATRDVGTFLREADWASYLADLVVHWDEAELPRSIYEKAKDIAASKVAGEFGIHPDEVLAIFWRNYEWSIRTTQELQIYERFRALSVELSQLYAFLATGYQVSTPSNYVRKLVTDTFVNHGLVTTIESQNPLLPILLRVAFDPRSYTVGDMLAIVEGKQFLEKLGVVELVLDELQKSEKRKEFGKNLSLYLLGLIPVLGTVANVLGALDLLKNAYKLLSKAEIGESILYFDISDVQIRDEQT